MLTTSICCPSQRDECTRIYTTYWQCYSGEILMVREVYYDKILSAEIKRLQAKVEMRNCIASAWTMLWWHKIANAFRGITWLPDKHSQIPCQGSIEARKLWCDWRSCGHKPTNGLQRNTEWTCAFSFHSLHYASSVNYRTNMEQPISDELLRRIPPWPTQEHMIHSLAKHTFDDSFLLQGHHNGQVTVSDQQSL